MTEEAATQVDDDPGHHHFQICPPEGVTVLCPKCKYKLEAVGICTLAEVLTALPCECALTVDEFEEAVQDTIKEVSHDDSADRGSREA
jgi:hypothetical protein